MRALLLQCAEDSPRDLVEMQIPSEQVWDEAPLKLPQVIKAEILLSGGCSNPWSL